RSANADASAAFSMSSSPWIRYAGSTVPDAICCRTAAMVEAGMRKAAAGRSEGLEDGAHDRPGEVGGQPIEGVGVLVEERRRIDGARAARRLVLLPQYHARILPERRVGVQVAKLDVRGHLDDVARRELLSGEARGRDGDRRDSADQHGVDIIGLREDL